ncbi:MAG TPA: flavin reductase [Clostridia bacterium]|nr:flavin reductase [Clostridia bacterium]
MAKQSVQISNDFCPQTLFLYGTYKQDGSANFGLFCWFSYNWNGGLGVMAAIGGEKLTKDRIREKRVFSANLVTEDMLPLADYLGNTDGYGMGKMAFPLEIERGRTLDVPILAQSPVAFELAVEQSVPLDGSEVFLCHIKNALHEECLGDEAQSVAARIARVRPVCTTCRTYFSWEGRPLGMWGEPGRAFRGV